MTSPRTTFTLALSIAALAAVIWMNWASSQAEKVLRDRPANDPMIAAMAAR